MNKNLIVGVILLVIIATAIIWYQSRQAKEEILPPEVGQSSLGASGEVIGIIPAPAANTVIYTENNFVPQELKIKASTSVSFKNESNEPLWVASDLHPTHKLLPGFDQLQGMERGEVYTYTFTQPGLWTYHNHLNAAHGGAIIVE